MGEWTRSSIEVVGLTVGGRESVVCGDSEVQVEVVMAGVKVL